MALRRAQINAAIAAIQNAIQSHRSTMAVVRLIPTPVHNAT
ncbi:hypothetical protein [Rhodopirellula sp. MGV]|nr:hypothetical protein [Rhodopirellula sp. MGV]